MKEKVVCTMEMVEQAEDGVFNVMSSSKSVHGKSGTDELGAQIGQCLLMLFDGYHPQALSVLKYATEAIEQDKRS